ncbi:large repetitive protein [Geofilum rubicundum JCM 15548]|uniref:Large repetitive protein n=1 Tax=Geofilum rubicundum JCM 15548 TaxID=1236989 RepID=A0A0E9LXW4_9BACT|nr:large repetitive protein [Geofilum rubicundum JCM 15548]
MLIICFIALSFSQKTVAQEEAFSATIQIRGRYVEGTGIELRYFPDRRAVLLNGLQRGLVLERAVGNGEFEELALLQPYSDQQWETAIAAAETDSETQDYLDLAYHFLQSATTPSGGNFSFEEGISEMRQQRADEDFEYAVFVLSAVREAQVAEALALSYTDSDVQPGATYTYRVRPVEEHPLYRVNPAPFTMEAVVDNEAYQNEVYVYEGDTELNFAWEETEHLSGYFVERRAPGETDFTPLNEAPLYNLSGQLNYENARGSYREEDLVNYQTYTYRFYASNLYGERVLVDEVKAMPRDRTPPEQPYLEKPEHVAPREVLVKWQMNENPAEDLMGFAVARSDAPEGDFRLLHNELLPAATRTFTDTSFVEGARNYYVVQAVDTAFNVSSSFPVAVTLIDTVPPVQPIIESGVIDSLGVVTLTMTQNPERDLMGYRIFRANDPEHEFSVIREGFLEIDSMEQQVQLVFTDTVTLNSLTPAIYYRARALDFNHNQSEFSDILRVERPDTIAPTTPVFKRLVNSTDQIDLYFALSESEDVVEQILYRKTSIEAPWMAYATIAAPQTQFTDTEVEQGTTYYYSMRARDNSGNFSTYAHPVFGKAYDNGVREVVSDLTLTEEEGTITLNWAYEGMNEDTFFVIYRTDNQGRLKTHRRAEGLSFSEPLRGEGPLSYAVRTHTTDGGQSPMSEVVTYEP